jgi:ABC-2 type transport system ATP-binding protein
VSIIVTDITKKFDEQVAVNKLSFNIGKNEIVGFLGPNGAGKSTTMKMLTGYLQPDSGKINICGLPVTTNSDEAKHKIGYLPESNSLYLDMYVREYLHFIGGIHHLKDIKSAVADVIALVGLRPEASKKIGQLSKGYKQRVGLAAALVHNPEVLILDEPTSGLDPNQIIEIREVIRNLAKEKTVLFSSHIMQEVEALCKRVIIIHQGNMVADASLDELKKQHAGAGAVFVRFKNEMTANQLQSVLRLDVLPKSDEHGFLITAAEPDQLVRQIMSTCIAEKWDLISIDTEVNSLERIFKKLTDK